MNNMFRDGTPAFNQDVSNWNVSNVTNMSAMFKGASSFNNAGSPNINNWDVSNVTNMSIMFADATVFNQPLSNWNVAKVTTMKYMFQRASAFNQNIGSWNLIKVTDISYMFFQANAFNNDGSSTINNWNTALVTDMTHVFSWAYAFNQPIGNWNTNNVTSIFAMFWVASSFNQDIGSWNVSKCTDFQSTFGGAVSFNNGGSPSINNWNVSNVTSLQDAFGNTFAFQQPLNNWNVSKVTNMRGAFKGSGFNQDISSWNTGNVTSMWEMFMNAGSFNQNLGIWNVDKVTNMVNMFSNASAFNQNLGSWKLNANVNLSNMLDYSGMDCSNYAATLVGWNANPSCPTGRTLGATGRTYGPSATAARANLVGAKGWTITGDALYNSCGASLKITAPANNSSFPAGSDITVTADANNPVGSIAYLDFFEQGNKLGTDSTAPYSLTCLGVAPGTYRVSAIAITNTSDTLRSDTITVNVLVGCTSSGTIFGEGYINIPGSTVSDLTADPSYPGSPSVSAQLSSFEYANLGDNYGGRLRGYICAPVTGDYVFYISGDDQAGLWVSTNDNPANKQLVAYAATYTGFREWNKFSTQQSQPIRLKAGTRYYVETLHKEYTYEDHLSVGWRLPDGTYERPIAGNRLSPYIPGSIGGNAVPNGFVQEMRAALNAKLQTSVLPNPSRSIFTVSLKGEEGKPVQVMVTDILGRVIETRSNLQPNGQLQMGQNWKPGIYILQVQQGDQRTTLKLVKE
jgi:hypothetical protein